MTGPQEATIIAAGTSIPFGSYTEALPSAAGTGAVVGPFADYGDSFGYRINNGASAPGTPVTIVFYGAVSLGNGNYRLYEIDRVAGDSVANSAQSGMIYCPPGCAFFTAKAFGNTSQNVTVEVYLERQVP